MINRELMQLMEDMLIQDELYRPSNFWENAAVKLAEEFNNSGIDKFRSLKGPLSFFVPTYGSPGNAIPLELRSQIEKLADSDKVVTKTKLTIDHYLSGELNALGDYRVLLASDNQEMLPYLHTFSESQYGEPIEHFEFNQRKFSRSSLNYLLGLVFLKKHLIGPVPKVVMEIGGGFGSLGEILYHSGINGFKYIDIDIPPTLFAAQSYLSQLVGTGEILTYDNSKKMDRLEISSFPSMTTLPAWEIERVKGEIDLFVNFISFQEMEPDIVTNYLSHVKRLGAKWLLLRNMREGKQKKQPNKPGVETPILSGDYVNILEGFNYGLVARNVEPFGYKTLDNFNSELLLFKAL